MNLRYVLQKTPQLIVAAFAVTLAAGQVAGQPLVESKAEAAYAEGIRQLKGQGVPVDQEKAFALFTRAVEQRHAAAQFELAKFYDGSVGSRYDTEKALQLLTASGESSYVKAQEQLAFIYLNGKPGISPRDTKQAFKWFDAAHRQGSLPAGCMLGDFYKNGWGTALDARKAFKLYSEAARRDSTCAARAQFELYGAYLNGSGVSPSLDQATRWLIKAAEGGNTNAQRTLGKNYVLGKGLAKNPELGKQWTLKSREGAFPHDDEQDHAHGHSNSKHGESHHHHGDGHAHGDESLNPAKGESSGATYRNVQTSSPRTTYSLR